MRDVLSILATKSDIGIESLAGIAVIHTYV